MNFPNSKMLSCTMGHFQENAIYLVLEALKVKILSQNGQKTQETGDNCSKIPGKNTQKILKQKIKYDNFGMTYVLDSPKMS